MSPGRRGVEGVECTSSVRRGVSRGRCRGVSRVCRADVVSDARQGCRGVSRGASRGVECVECVECVKGRGGVEEVSRVLRYCTTVLWSVDDVGVGVVLCIYGIGCILVALLHITLHGKHSYCQSACNTLACFLATFASSLHFLGIGVACGFALQRQHCLGWPALCHAGIMSCHIHFASDPDQCAFFIPCHLCKPT